MTITVPFDIETIPQQPEDQIKNEIARTIEAPSKMSKPETIAAWHNGDGKYAGEKDSLIEETYRKTCFDATKGEICSIAWCVDDGDIYGYGAYDGLSEKGLLKTFFESVSAECGRVNPYLVGHNIGEFDLRFLWQRAVILGVDIPFDIPVNGRHKSDYFCTMKQWIGWKGYIKMDVLADALGVKGKGEMDGSKVWPAWKAGKYDEVVEYNKDDIGMLRNIYNRIK